jgi:hypothetical protein
MSRQFVIDMANPRWMDVLAFCGRTIREYAKTGRRVLVTLGEPKRNSESNAAMWAMLHDLEQQVGWRRARWRGDVCVEQGRYVLLSEHPEAARLTDEEFKDVCTAALKRPRLVGGIDGGVVAVGLRTSRMTQREMGDLLDLIGAFGGQLGVRWTEPKEKARAAA